MRPTPALMRPTPAQRVHVSEELVVGNNNSHRAGFEQVLSPKPNPTGLRV